MAEEMTSAAPGRMYCRRCAYDLRLLDKPRCPECGTPFDPADGRTFRRPPPRAWAKWLRRAGALILLATMLLGGAWGWMYWGWRQEQRALAQFPRASSTSEPVGPQWLYPRLGRAGFVLMRVRELVLAHGGPSDLAPVAKLTRLEALYVLDAPVRDISPLSKLRSLKSLSLVGTQVRDVSPLASARAIEWLDLTDAPVQDISPLAALSRLYSLCLMRTGVRDFSCVMQLPKLRLLWVPYQATDEQMSALQRALPACKVWRQ